MRSSLESPTKYHNILTCSHMRAIGLFRIPVTSWAPHPTATPSDQSSLNTILFVYSNGSVWIIKQFLPLYLISSSETRNVPAPKRPITNIIYVYTTRKDEFINSFAELIYMRCHWNMCVTGTLMLDTILKKRYFWDQESLLHYIPYAITYYHLALKRENYVS